MIYESKTQIGRKTMTKPAIVIVEHFPEILHKLKNDLEQKYRDRFRIIEADSSKGGECKGGWAISLC
jgi:hypothetical protein